MSWLIGGAAVAGARFGARHPRAALVMFGVAAAGLAAWWLQRNRERYGDEGQG